MLTKFAGLLLSLLSHLDPGSAWLGATEEIASVEWIESAPVATVQLDLLPDPEGAEQLAEVVAAKLVGTDFEVFVELVGGDAELPPSYRVVVGPFEDFEDAKRAQAELSVRGLDGFVRDLEPFVGC